jgi:hypothetical protein
MIVMMINLIVYHRSDSISLEKQDNKGRLSVDNSLEKEYDAALSRSDIQQQVRASIASLPGDLQISNIRLSRRRSWLAGKISLNIFVHLNSN